VKFLPHIGCFLSLQVAVCAQALQSGNIASPSKEAPLELPKIEVLEEFDAKGWLYGRLGSTEILSQLSIKKTQELTADLVIFREFLASYCPEAAPPRDLPITIVLFGKDYRDFGGLTKSDRRILAASDRYMFVNCDGIDAYWTEREIRERLMEIGFRSSTKHPCPLWRRLALIQIYSSVQVDHDRIEIGYPPLNPHSLGGKITRPAGGRASPTYSMQFGLMYGDTIPLDALLNLTAENAPDHITLYKHGMQATAFMHLCLYNYKNKKLRESFNKFVDKSGVEPFNEQLFQECFGKSSAEMHSLVRAYLFGSSIKYETFRYKISPGPKLELREAQPKEVLTLLRQIRFEIAPLSGVQRE
jgi:hypothetical protein